MLRKDSWPIAGQHRARCLPGRTTRHYQHVKIHALTAARMFALVLGCGALACAASGDLPDDGGSSGAGGSSGGGGKATGGAGSGGSTVAGSSGFTSGGSNTGGAGKGGSTTGSGGTSGSNTGGSGGAGGSAAGAGNMGGSFGGTGVGGSGAGGSGTGGSAAGAGNTGGNAGGGSGGESAGTGGSSGGAGGAGGGVSGSSGGGAGGSTGGTGGSIGEPDCNAQMPGGGQLHSGNGTGGQGNLAWEIWSNTGEGELTTFSTPAFIATWNNSGGYLGRLGFEWGGFQGNPVPHTERGEIKAQFVSRKTGTAGGYSYIGMYGWTTNPCVEWYVVDDSYNNMPINPGNTTNEGDVNIDGGTYVVYTRPTTGSGGTRCSGATDWIQYYSVRRTARACGVISLSEHFRKWEELGMDMGGELLEAKILVEVGGGVGNVELPIANVNVQ